jgi:predicted dehydrogenase
MNTLKQSRRAFLRNGTLIAAAPFFISKLRAGESANDKLNIGAIGIGGRGGEDLNGCASQNIVAICDVDDNIIESVGKKFPSAKKYNDFRQLLDQKDIDAVVVGTPDHTHAVATVAALKSGRHVYCEKPLTHTVSECRRVRETALKAKKITQMGTQIHAGDNYRRVVELIQRDVIGPVREVHVWVNVVYGGKRKPTEFPPVPAGLHYDLWAGPVEAPPYHPDWVPFRWRNWWVFGGGTMSDFGCHYMDLPHWALDLREAVSVECEGPEVDPDCPPVWMIGHFEYPARGQKPPVKLTWYQGGKQPERLSDQLKTQWKSGVLFVGEKGELIADYGRHALLPEKQFEGFVRPEPFIPNSIGHHKEWYEACKHGGATTCNFDYSGALTETVLLGTVAYRTGKKIIWDAKKLKAQGCPEADQYIQHHYRKGWTI